MSRKESDVKEEEATAFLSKPSPVKPETLTHVQSGLH